MGGGRTEGVKDEDEWQRAGTEDHTCMAQGPGVAAAWTGMEEEHGHISCCTIVFIFLFAGRSFKFPTFRQYYWNTNLAPTQVTLAQYDLCCC